MNVIEEYEERKRLRRSRFRWRLAALVAVCAALGMFFANQQPRVGPHIAQYTIAGVIDDDLGREETLKRIAENDDAEALILTIDSPGGGVVASEIIFNAVRDIADKKPVVAVMRNVAASGGYMAAIAADHIIARGNTITGSVGVIAQMPNASDLLERVGVSMLEIKSGDLKAQPSPFNPVQPAALKAQQDMVTESFEWFLGLVKERRTLSNSAVESVVQGGVFTGRQAVKIGLIDALGGQEQAIEWLENNHDIAIEHPIIDYQEPENEPFPSLADLFGLSRNNHAVFSSGLYTIYK